MIVQPCCAALPFDYEHAIIESKEPHLTPRYACERPDLLLPGKRLGPVDLRSCYPQWHLLRDFKILADRQSGDRVGYRRATRYELC